MGNQQLDLLRRELRRILQRNLGNPVRSTSNGGPIGGAKTAPSPPSSSGGSGLNSTSKLSPDFSSSSSRGFFDTVGHDSPSAQKFFVLQEISQPLCQESLELAFPTQMRRRLYINLFLGHYSVLTPVGNVVRVFGSLPTLSRRFASLSGEGTKANEKVGEAVAWDGFRGEGQGGDEGLTASVSGRDTAAKNTRRRKVSAEDALREVSSGAAPASRKVMRAVVDAKGTEDSARVEVSQVTKAGIDLREAELAGTNAQIVNEGPRYTTAARRKQNKEAISPEEATLKAAVAQHEQSLDSVSSSSTCSYKDRRPVCLEDGLSSNPQCTPTNPIFGMDSIEEIPAPRNVPDGASERILEAFSTTVWSDSELAKQLDSKKMVIESSVRIISGVGITQNEQAVRKSSLTSAVEEYLKDQDKQKTLNADTADVVQSKQDKHLEPGTMLKSDSSLAVDSSADGADYTDPNKVYRILQASRGGKAYQVNEKGRLNKIFHRFSGSGWVSDQALSLYINSRFFPSAAGRFRRFFLHKSSPELRSYLIAKGPTNEALQFLFPVFAEFCIQEFSDEIRRYRELVSTADLTKPDAWYPFARAMKRRVIYHKGPTNSGKTYRALKRLMEAESGIYCSPLRLLAMEVFDTVNMQGVYCNLHTGQEKKDVPFANHLACTIEMCYLTRQWEVAVIDEIQMMSDEYRGWAWTRAFLGLQADEVHVCGDPSALPLIRNLCAGTGDELVENEYERFKPLKVAEESLRGDFRNIQAGDCIVAFSRRDIFDIKREVELATKHRCCVVYGALPPETRTQQAKLFNEQDNGYDVLVASDAIGMGLNLNIRRVVFFSLDKFDGDSKKPVPPAQVKQIAGRAGRRGSMYPEGVTTTFFSQDLPYLDASLVQDFEPSTAAGLFPVYEQVELFASQLPNENFATLLERFSETCKLDGAYFLCRYDNLKRVANMLEKVKGLSLEDRFNFCFAPVNVRDPQSMGALYRYATAFSQKIPVHVEMGVPSSSARDEFELLDLEARHQVLSMYLWLSQHFPGDLFPQKEQAGEMASQIAVLLGQSLVQSSRRWSKRELNPAHGRGRPLPNMRPVYKGKDSSRKSGLRQVGTSEHVIRV